MFMSVGVHARATLDRLNKVQGQKVEPNRTEAIINIC